MKGRYIGENIRLLYDLIFYTKLRKKPGMLLLIDFEKTFDSVSHKFMFKAFKFPKFWNFYYKMDQIIQQLYVFGVGKW